MASDSGVLQGISVIFSHEFCTGLPGENCQMPLYLQEGPGVSDGCVDLEPVSYDLRITEQAGNVVPGVPGDFPGVEIVKRFSVSFPFFQDGGPAQSCLRPFQYEKLEQGSFVVNCYAPFSIVIGLF